MWSKLWTWAKGNKLLAIGIVVLGVVALESVTAGIPARRAAAGYFQCILDWQKAYNRDTAASKKKHEAEMKTLTAERDTLRKKYAAAKGRIDGPWLQPVGSQELEARYRALGYQGRVK